MCYNFFSAKNVFAPSAVNGFAQSVSQDALQNVSQTVLSYPAEGIWDFSKLAAFSKNNTFFYNSYIRSIYCLC